MQRAKYKINRHHLSPTSYCWIHQKKCNDSSGKDAARQHRRIKRYAFSVDLHSSRMWTSDPQRSESGTKKDFSMYAYEVDQLTHMWTHKMICFLVSSSWQTIYGTGYFQVCKEKHCFFKWIFQLHWIDCISLPKTHRDAWETNWAKKFWCRKKVATFAVWEQSNVTKS